MSGRYGTEEIVAPWQRRASEYIIEKCCLSLLFNHHCHHVPPCQSPKQMKQTADITSVRRLRRPPESARLDRPPEKNEKPITGRVETKMNKS